MTMWLLKHLCAKVRMDGCRRLSNLINFAIGGHCKIGVIVTLDLLSFGKQIQEKLWLNFIIWEKKKVSFTQLFDKVAGKKVKFTPII